ncbi:DUF4386 domain-containing protein [Nocardioides eburneiflavus]|uniref:DUF4386 domain-containing protein n=1 Tax=Nocardioides eburneiflavus TaxID=2518372 RepID=A0A4Z1BP08_9ACTN|nr:DUF4386 domain-containing protein [Nocardioides eburneiflavus]TGN63051.1 DUF4386 domain-containing protein [Nocardioides eburneiflavus]
MNATTASTTTNTPATTTATTGPTTAPRTAAVWAAGGYLAIFVLAIFANFLALSPVIHPGDAAGTAAALQDSETSFRLGAVAFVGIFIIDVVVAWALWVLFRPVHRDLSLLSAWFRLTYTVVLGAALGFLYAAIWLAGTPDAFGEATDDAVLLALQTFDFTWVAGLAAFGAHLVVLGVLLLRARGPRWIAWLLLAAGAAYAVDTVAHLLLADYEASADLFLAIVAVPSVIGEMSFAVWLLLVATGRRVTPAAPVEGARASAGE